VDEIFDTDLEFKNDEHIFGFYGNCVVTDINLIEERTEKVEV